jgi:tetratricopeptide (TPR) repeat protein
MGEDDLARGNAGRAAARFREAARTTAALLADAPGDPTRLYAQAQSEYWAGYIDYIQGNYDRARIPFEQYRVLAGKLIKLDPSNVEWLKEEGYAEGNLCTIELGKRGDATRALSLCKMALAHMVEAATLLPATRRAEVAPALANRHGWLAEAYRANGDDGNSEAHFKRQEEIVNDLIARDPRNLEFRDTWVTLQFTFAEIDARRGRRTQAQARLQSARSAVRDMIRHDPANITWQHRLDRIETDLKRVH